MKFNKQTKKLVNRKVSLALFLSDLVALSLAYFVSWFSFLTIKGYFLVSLSEGVIRPYEYLSDYAFIALCPIILSLFFLKGHYTQRVPWWSQVRYLFLLCVLAFGADCLFRLGLRLPLLSLLVTVNWIYSFVFILLGRQVVYQILSRQGIWQKNAVVIGSVNTVTDILYAFDADGYAGYNIKSIFLRDRDNKEFDVDAVPTRYANINICRDQMEYIDFIKENTDSFFIVCLETFRGEQRDSLIKELIDLNVLYSVVPPTSSISLSEMKPQNFFGCDIMMLHSKYNIYSVLGRFLKRTMDILGASIVLILASPIFILVSLALKIEGQGGSIFYGGYRLGYEGKKFKCWKFRSMEPDSDHLLHALIDSDPAIKEDWEKFRKLKGEDPRVTTKTARIIRKLSIDEIPQVWNVLMGDMSLVGPRPILENEQELFGDSYSNYIKVRPGITGLWQVSGRNDTSFQRRVYMDDWYIRNWSIWGDIVIMIKTLNVVLKQAGSY